MLGSGKITHPHLPGGVVSSQGPQAGVPLASVRLLRRELRGGEEKRFVG